MPTRALVLGGGGLAGIAWELGVAKSLIDAGVDLLAADVVIGTSAGSVVGSVLRSADELDAAYAAQVSGETDAEVGADLDLMALAQAFMDALSNAKDPADARARIAAAALRAETVSEDVRVRVVAQRLPSQDWPDYDLRVTAIEAPSGQFAVFDKHSGVPLVRAVAASCAVPLVWPPVTIDGRRYIDGGLRSTTNADLAAGYERVLVLAPFPPQETIMGVSLAAEVAQVQAQGKVHVVEPDAETTALFGVNPLDPVTRKPSAEAGLAAGARLAAAVGDLWG